MYFLLLPVSQGDRVEQISDEDSLLPIFIGLVEADEPIRRGASLRFGHVGQIGNILLHPMVDFIVQLFVFDGVLDERPLRLHLILYVDLHLLAVVLKFLLALVVLQLLVVPYLLPSLSGAHEVLAMVHCPLRVVNLLQLDIRDLSRKLHPHCLLVNCGVGELGCKSPRSDPQEIFEPQVCWLHHCFRGEDQAEKGVIVHQPPLRELPSQL